MNQIRKAWLIPGIALCVYSFYAMHSGEVYIYQRYESDYIINSSVDNFSYWLFTMGYLHMGMACFLFAFKEFYPWRLYRLMEFDEKTRLSIAQVVFILLICGVMYSSPFYFARALSNV